MEEMLKNVYVNILIGQWHVKKTATQDLRFPQASLLRIHVFLMSSCVVGLMFPNVSKRGTSFSSSRVYRSKSGPFFLDSSIL